VPAADEAADAEGDAPDSADEEQADEAQADEATQ
jgi:hypothetical protein